MKTHPIIGIVVLIAYGIAADDYGLWQGCFVPSLDQVADFAWDQSDKASGGYYFPISSTSDEQIEIGMLGRHSAKCVRMNWNDDRVTVNYFYSPQGSGNAYFHCEQVHRPKNMWKCKHLKSDGVHPDLSHTAWITLTDDHTYSFTVRCFHHTKQYGWVVFSTEKQLSRRLTNEILDHAKSLGLSTLYGRDVHTRNYNEYDCPPVCLV